ncbi:unnamed protein product, partial [Discosporangium mesarthrocarpum]
TPNQIGVAEREWCRLMAMIRCFLSVPGLPKALWPKAVQAAVNIPSTFLQRRTPFEVWMGRIPKLHQFKVLGATAILHVETHKSKLLQRG